MKPNQNLQQIIINPQVFISSFTEIDECSSDPCKYGATCKDAVNAYSCECAAGFKGTNCDEIDDCKEGVCLTLGAAKVLYTEARKSCTDNGKSLIEFSTEEDFEFALNFLKAKKEVDEANDYTEHFWTDQYWYNYKIYMQGGELAWNGVWTGEVEQAVEHRHYRIKGRYTDGDSEEGYVVSNDQETHYALCRNPARTTAAGDCFGDPEICYIAGDTILWYPQAFKYCKDQGASLVQIEDKAKYDDVVHFAKLHTRAATGAYKNTRHFWTNMHYVNEKAYLPDSTAAYTKLSEPWYDDDKFTQIVLRLNQGNKDAEGYIKQNVRGHSHYPLCEKPAKPPVTEYCYGDFCLFMGTSKVSFTDADSYCQGQGGTLASILDADDDTYNYVTYFLRTFTSTINIDYLKEGAWTSMFIESGNNVWTDSTKQTAGYDEALLGNMQYDATRRLVLLYSASIHPSMGFLNYLPHNLWYPLCQKASQLFWVTITH